MDWVSTLSQLAVAGTSMAQGVGVTEAESVSRHSIEAIQQSASFWRSLAVALAAGVVILVAFMIYESRKKRQLLVSLNRQAFLAWQSRQTFRSGVLPVGDEVSSEEENEMELDDAESVDSADVRSTPPPTTITSDRGDINASHGASDTGRDPDLDRRLRELYKKVI